MLSSASWTNARRVSAKFARVRVHEKLYVLRESVIVSVFSGFACCCISFEICDRRRVPPATSKNPSVRRKLLITGQPVPRGSTSLRLVLPRIRIKFILYTMRDIAPSDRDNQAIWICASRRAAGAGRRPARVPCCAAPARRDAAAYEPLVLSGSCRYTIRQNHSGRTSRALTDNAVQRVTLHVISRIFRSSSSLDHQHVPVLYMC